MRKSNSTRMLLFFIIMIFNQIDSFGQFSSLKDSPMFKNNKHNIFRETLTNTYYEMSEMDSLYKTGKSPFQILKYIKKGDSIVWMIKFINEDDFTIKSQWLNKKFPLKDFVDIHNIQIKTSELTGKFLIILNNVLGVKSYPTTFIVDKKGFIKQIIEGVNLDEQKKPKIYSEIMETLKRIE